MTIIGEQIFSTWIGSQKSERTAIDFRRSYEDLEGTYRPYQLPSAIEAKLHLLMKKLDLSFGALDLILTPDEQYVFVEINAAGQFDWLQAETGAPLIETLVALLIRGRG